MVYKHGSYKSYTASEEETIWSMLSAKLQGLMKDTGSFKALSDQLLYHAADLSPSPSNRATNAERKK